MTEANPPAQPEELRRRILLYLSKADGQDDYRHLFQIATDFGETPKEIRDQLEILESQGLVDVDFFTNGNALPTITGKGKLEVEKIAQEAPQPDPPPSSEPQEFRHNKDYSVVIWRGKEYFLTVRQAKCVRLLHEAHTDGTRWLRGKDILSKVIPSRKGNENIRLSDIFKDSPAWNDGLVDPERRYFYRLNL